MAAVGSPSVGSPPNLLMAATMWPSKRASIKDSLGRRGIFVGLDSIVPESDLPWKTVWASNNEQLTGGRNQPVWHQGRHLTRRGVLWVLWDWYRPSQLSEGPVFHLSGRNKFPGPRSDLSDLGCSFSAVLHGGR